ncbi:MAG TPA: IcmT/TraK family protein [Alphaproteobacteria bacterium]|nr:type IV secretion protein IcmT [Alphaproteobacteria bacterium]HCS22269.1 type IV secretion protein IcmT [Rhodospirillaceae bacterium]HRJ65787.1 IcmT/TraK family protein [Alphaproteobacteria bacterium]
MADNKKQAEDEGRGWHWRNTMKTVRFFSFDARAGIFVALLLVHFRIWTLCLLVLMLMIFYLLERRGLSFPAAMRSLRVWFIGTKRPGWIWTRRRKLQDTGS